MFNRQVTSSTVEKKEVCSVRDREREVFNRQVTSTTVEKKGVCVCEGRGRS